MKDSGSYSKKIVDDLLDQITGGDHSKTIYQLKQVGLHYAEKQSGKNQEGAHICLARDSEKQRWPFVESCCKSSLKIIKHCLLELVGDYSCTLPVFFSF